MNKLANWKQLSLHAVIKTSFLAILAVMVFFIAFYNFYSVWLVQEQITQSNLRTISVYSENVDENLVKIDRYLSEMVANSPEFSLLGTKDSKLNSHVWGTALVRDMSGQLRINPSINSLHVYSRVNDLHLTASGYQSGSNFDQRQSIQDAIRTVLESETGGSGGNWEPLEIGGSNYLYRLMGVSGVSVAAIVEFQDIAVNMNHLNMADEYRVVFIDAEGNPLTDAEEVEKAGVELAADRLDKPYLSGSPKRYWVIGRELRHANAHMVALVPGRGFFQGLSTWHLLIFAISVVALLALPMLYYKASRAVLPPLKDITATIRKIGEGSDELMKPEQYRFQELREVGGAFNRMLGQIQSLKIEAYERELEKQHAQLQYLHLQIHPHFFLNCLKGIFGLAEQKKLGEIQEMILGLSGYFRYMFRDNLQTVPIRDELSHVKYFIQLQRLTTQETPVCNVDVEQRALNCRIPPLCIQTFVENSVWHGVKSGSRLEVDLCLSVLEADGRDFIDITVGDNGTGFSDDVLAELNAPVEDMYRDRHVGIHNVKTRMKLIYGEDVQLFFYNNGKGAVSELILPMDRQADMGTGNGSDGC